MTATVQTRTVAAIAGGVVALLGFALPGASAASAAPRTSGLAPAAATATTATATTEAQLVAQVAAAAPGTTVNLPAATITLTKPLAIPAGVTLAGAGQDLTTLRISRANWANFGYSFLIVPGANSTGVVVQDLTVDGSRTKADPSAADSPTENQGGGIKLGNSWTVRNVRFANINYFAAWIRDVTDVTITGCRFDGDSGSTGQKDNIGGGRAAQVVIAGNTFKATARGNAVDLMRSSDLTIRDNVISGTATQEHNIYLEAVNRAQVTGNTLSYSAIGLKSDAGYSGVTKPVNPAGITVSGNKITNSKATGVSVTYTAGTDGMVAGGGNVVTGNAIANSGLAGIAIVHCVPGATTTPDQITSNNIANPFTRGDAKWGTGCGTVAASGIAITAGSGTVITGNTVSETRSTPLMAYGIYLGAERAKAPLTAPAVSGNTVTGATKAPVGTYGR